MQEVSAGPLMIKIKFRMYDEDEKSEESKTSAALEMSVWL